MHTASQEFLLLPEKSAECHQTLSSQVGSGHKAKQDLERYHKLQFHFNVVYLVGFHGNCLAREDLNCTTKQHV